MTTEAKENDAALLAACREATEADEAFDAAIEASDKPSPEVDALLARECAAFEIATATDAATPAGLAAKAALLVRWQDYPEDAARLSLSIAKDAIMIAQFGWPRR